MRHKFKAWDKNTHDWYDDSNQYLVICLDGKIFNCWNGEVMEDYTDRIVLLKYTGLRDKNNIESCEGDILYAVDIKNPYFWKQHSSGKCVIEWQDGSFVTRYKNQQYPDSMLESAECFDKFEIIGDIYDNPELLEEGEVG